MLRNKTSRASIILSVYSPSSTQTLTRLIQVSPTVTKCLVEAGYVIDVERSAGRIFDDEEIEAAGATLVPEGSWVKAPKDHIIVGLKELLEDDCRICQSP